MEQKMKLQLTMARNGKEVCIPICKTSTNMGRFMCGLLFAVGLFVGTLYYCPLSINYKTFWDYNYFVLVYSLTFVVMILCVAIVNEFNKIVDKMLKRKQKMLWQKNCNDADASDLNELRIAGAAARNDIYDDTAAAVHSICGGGGGGGGVVIDDDAAQPKKRRFASLKEE